MNFFKEKIKNLLSLINIKGLCIEINENFKTQYKKVISILKKNNFRILHKKHSKEFDLKINKFNKTFNYIFIR